MKILLVTMGGTIDAEAYPEDEALYPAYSTMKGENRAALALKKIFAEESQGHELDVIAVCDKDSKNIGDKDRLGLSAVIAAADRSYELIVVTVGTDRMAETARDLQRKNPEVKCPVVFTGAIWPLANGEKSDGWGNLRKAASGLRANPGIYIAMGELFARAEHVFKDFSRKIFVERKPDVA